MSLLRLRRFRVLQTVIASAATATEPSWKGTAIHDGFATEPFLRWHYWTRKKWAQVAIRAHLSPVLAVLLALLVLWREWSELDRALTLLTAWEWLLLRRSARVTQ